MEFFKKSIFLVLVVLCFSNCGSKQQRQMDFTQEIAQTYYQTQLVDEKQQVVRIYFYIEFKEPISEEFSLLKIYFRNKEAEITKVSDRKYLARFTHTVVREDLILDNQSTKEYGNKAPIITKGKFELNKNEAILEYQKNNETFFFKLRRIDEKQ